MQPLSREIRTFAAACEHLISREPTTVLTDDEYSLLTYSHRRASGHIESMANSREHVTGIAQQGVDVA